MGTILFPNSWYQIAWSEELTPGRIKAIQFCDRKAVAFRTHEGDVSVLDAFCPHLGANLSGGKVVDDTIRCPFHHWQFDARGQCVHIPYATRIPPKARVRRYPVCEANGIVFVYFHDRYQEPAGPIEPMAEYAEGKLGSWLKRVRTVKAPLIDLAENTADWSHILALHGLHRVDTRYESHGAKGFRIVNDTDYRLPGGFMINHRIDMTMFQPGYSTIHFNLMGGGIAIACGTPLDRENLRYHFSFASHADYPRFFRTVRRYFLSVAIMYGFGQDVPIWEAKKYLFRPALCAEEESLGAFRKWYRQFYSPGVYGAAEDAAIESIEPRT